MGTQDCYPPIDLPNWSGTYLGLQVQVQAALRDPIRGTP
ncbi:hypothetical protein C8K30_1011103 [Promicromonospora sp. AC04]|nr:hypothetical protein C8K30_1011103 [Promicromonospora sp. AC04]